MLDTGDRFITEKDVMVPMRDGVELAADIYRPEGDGKVPALVGISHYGKEVQAMALTLPPHKRPSPVWDGCIEAGDIREIVGRGYGHVIADVRGSGGSGGEMIGNYDLGGDSIGKDIYDLVQWLAEQPWCNGNVGMVGISYFATVQIMAALEKPPALKAIFCNGGHFNIYEFAYHDGVCWLMPRASFEGRGGDAGVAVGDVRMKTKKDLSEAEYEALVKERLEDPDIRNWPNAMHVLHYPKAREMWADVLLNPCDGPFWRENSPIERIEEVDIPVYLQMKWGRGWNIDGNLEVFERLKGPKKMDFLPLPPIVERPFHEHHNEMFRWYDYWLKGEDTGIMDEPPLNIHVEGEKYFRTADQWPLPETDYTRFYLRPIQRLLGKPEPLSPADAPPDGFYQPPLTVTTKVESLTWTTDAFREDVEMIGPGALTLFVELDSDDTNFIAKIYDVDPQGKRHNVTSAILKASHRELDEDRSEPWHPVHPNTRRIPVPAGEIIEYKLKVYSFAWVFKKGHKLELKLACNEPFEDPEFLTAAPEGQHLPSGRATTHKIYRDNSHQSNLLLPIIPKK